MAARIRSTRRALVAPLLTLVGGLALAVPAARAGERELVVTPALGFAALRVDGHTAYGGTAHLDVDYGFTDAWSLRTTGRYALTALGPGEPHPVQLASLALGALYTFDVLKVVPWAGLALGASWIHGGPATHRVNAELQASLGADYLVRRDFSVGLELRYALQVPDAARFPYLFSVLLRLSWRQQ